MGSRRGWLAIAALALAACASPEERAARHVERAEAYLAEDQPDAALLEFQNALKLQPGNAALYEQIGDVLFERNRTRQESLLYYQEAYRLDNSRIRAAMRQARLLAFSDAGRASELVATGLERAPDDPEVHATHSLVSMVAGDLGTSLEAAKRAVELAPDSLEAWTQLGNVHVARAAARRKLRLPQLDEPFLSALQAYEKVATLSPDGPARALLEQGRIFWFWGRNQEAERVFSRAIDAARELDSPDEVVYVASVTQDYASRVQNLGLQQRALRAWVDASPDSDQAWEQLAQVMDQLPDHTGEEVLLEMLEKRPLDPAAHLLYANYLLGAQRPNDALAHLRRAMDQGVSHPALGEALVRVSIARNQLAEARAAYVETSEAFPDAFPTRLAEAEIALAEGRVEEAESQLRALREEQETSELLRLLALASYRRGDLESAGEAIEASLALGPASPGPVLRLRARVAAAAGSWDRALESLERLALAGRTLSEAERVLQARALYGAGREREGHMVLYELLARRAPNATAALTFVELEGDRDPMHARNLLDLAYQNTRFHLGVLKALTRLEIENGWNNLALVRLNALVKKRGPGPQILLLRAETLASMGAYEYAEADVLRAFEADPSLPEALDLLHELYRAQGKVEEATRSFEQAEQAGVLHAGARLLLARLYMEQGDTLRARETLEAVADDPSTSWTARSELALVLALRGEELERALELARQADQQAEGAPRAADVLGTVLLKSSQPQAALQEFQRSAELLRRRHEAVPPTLHYHRGLALRALGRDQEAIEAFQEALGLGDFPEAEDARQQIEAAGHSLDQPGRNS